MNNTSKYDEAAWDHTDWSNKFRAATLAKDGYQELRTDVFKDTVKIVKNGGSRLGQINCPIENQAKVIKTIFYKNPPKVVQNANNTETKIAVINADCIETARLISLSGYHPVVLNMANRQNPGGGVINGAGAQEENIFRRSNLYVSLYQFVDYSSKYNIKRNTQFSYPLNRDTGGIYSQAVTIFRGSEANGYCLLNNHYQLSFVTVPAINNPDLELINGEYRIVPALIEPAMEKIRTILRIALNNGHDSAVLSAFGCGAFGNPPKHMAALFHEVFNEDEFLNKLKLIVFAIIDDHNARKAHNPEGNVLPFLREFE